MAIGLLLSGDLGSYALRYNSKNTHKLPGVVEQFFKATYEAPLKRRVRQHCA